MRLIDADKLHYKRIHFYDIKNGECCGLKSAVVVFADEIGKNKNAMISPDDVRGFGKWIPLDYSDEAYGNMYKCAKCGCSEIGEPNYCPNCGAKMEVSE